MRIEPQLHLTYCSNIHPGETWEETFTALKNYIPVIRRNFPGAFGIGLRLSGIAADTLAHDMEALSRFQGWLADNNAYVFTVNGFPYGKFHETVVKQDVHKPDWLSEERVIYTVNIARILARLLEDGEQGGISTSPLGYRHWYKDRQSAMTRSVRQLVAVVMELHKIHETTGKLIHLDIEPEPDGILENSLEFIQFYKELLLPVGGRLLREAGYSSPSEIILRHVQLCYDVCHFSIEFEKTKDILFALKAEGIQIGKVQISAALKAEAPDAQAYAKLGKFNESTYLHQAVGKRGNALVKYTDLGPLLAEAPELDEVRCHFHVPIFTAEFGGLASTQSDIVETLRACKQHPFTQHLEVETYTWQVLPKGLEMPLSASITRELNWVIKQWQSL